MTWFVPTSLKTLVLRHYEAPWAFTPRIISKTLKSLSLTRFNARIFSTIALDCPALGYLSVTDPFKPPTTPPVTHQEQEQASSLLPKHPMHPKHSVHSLHTLRTMYNGLGDYPCALTLLRQCTYAMLRHLWIRCSIPRCKGKSTKLPSSLTEYFVEIATVCPWLESLNLTLAYDSDSDRDFQSRYCSRCTSSSGDGSTKGIIRPRHVMSKLASLELGSRAFDHVHHQHCLYLDLDELAEGGYDFPVHTSSLSTGRSRQ